MYSELARYTSSEASSIVRAATKLDGREARENDSRRTFRVQQECMYPELAKLVSQASLASKATMSEVGKDVKIPDFWRMSALLEICSRDVKEQMLMRLDEIGENCHENLKAKVVSYTTNKTKQARGGQQETKAPMEVDHVSGSEPEVEDW